MEPLAVSIACLLLLVAAIVLEFWVPSFGLLTLSAVALFIVSVFTAFSIPGPPAR
ncbi:MAG: hypothetical protein M5U26_15725 [Planctomycetota bacterium]|nr:hypothetical protein [Planctomycetota bacterium]